MEIVKKLQMDSQQQDSQDDEDSSTCSETHSSASTLSTVSSLVSSTNKMTCSGSVSVPKVLRKDIRRSYADMLANVTNSADIRNVEGFFSTFSRRDLMFVEDCENTPSGERLRNTQLSGMAVFLQFWFNRMTLVPDGVVQINDVKVVTRSDTEDSRVICGFSFDGTRLYDLPYETVMPSDEQKQWLLSQDVTGDARRKRKMDCKKVTKLSISKQTELLRSSGGGESDDRECSGGTYVVQTAVEYDTSVVDAVSSAALLPTPMDIAVRGVFIIWLDANKYITKLQLQTAHQPRGSTSSD